MRKLPQRPEPYKLTNPFSLNIPRCRHLKVNGTQCGSPALKDHRFCFFHQQWHERKLVINSHISRENTNSRVPHSTRGSLSGGGRTTITLPVLEEDRKSTRLNSSHSQISYAVFCLKKKK